MKPVAWLLPLALMAAFSYAPAALAVTCTSVAGGGNWNAPATWTGCAGGNGTVANTPGPADTAIKAGAGTVTVNVAVTVGALTINAGTVTQTQTLTVSGTLGITGGLLTSNNALTVTGPTNITGGTLTINAAGARQFTGAVTISGGATWNNSGNRAVTFGNNLSSSGTFTSGTALQTFTAAPATLGGTAAMTFAGAVTANNGLTVNKSGSTVTINGALNVSNLTVTAGTLNLANTVAVTGTTSISGTLAHTTTTGTRTFTNAVTINSGGTWSNAANEAVSFGNNLSNDGTFTSGTATMTFTGASPQLGGGAAMTFAGAVTANNGLVINRTSAAATVAVTGTTGVTGALQVTQGTLTTNGTLTVSTTLTVAAAGTLNLANNATVTSTSSISGALNITSATGTKTFTGAVTINNGGTWNNSANEAVTMSNSLTNNGTFTSGTGAYTFQTTAGAVWAGTNGLSFGGAVTVSASRTNNTTVTVTGALALSAGVTFTNNSAVTALGNVTGANATTSIWTNAVNSTLNVSGTLMATGVLNASANPNTVNYAGAAQTVKLPSTNTYNNLTLSGSGTKTMPATAMNITGNFNLPATGTASATLAANLTITGNLLVNTNGGTLSLATFTANRTAAGGTLEVGAGSTLRIGGTNTVPTNYSTRTYNATSTTDYFGTAQAVRAETYGNLTLSGSGNKTMAAGTTNIEGNLLISAGPTYVGTTNNPTVNLRGNFTRSGTFNSGTGVFTFNGNSGVQTLTGASTFTNMTVNNTDLGLSLANNMTVTTAGAGSLVLTNGVVTTNANVLIATRPCNNVATVTRTNGYVVGNFQKTVPNGSTTCVFEVGGSGNYSPASLAFTGVGGAGGGLIGRVGSPVGDHPNIGTSGLNATRSVNRWWGFTTTGVTGTALPAFTHYGATLTFVAGDVDGGANTANFEIERWNGATWAVTTVGTRTPTSTQATGITALGDLAVAEKTVVITPPDSFNAVEVMAAVNGTIFTKLRGAGFTLDIVALNSGGTLEGGFTDTVQVDLIANAAATTCAGGTPIGGTSQNVDLTKGRGTTTAFTVATAYPNVRVRIQYPSLTLTRCSADNFAIKPTAFSITSTDATNTGTGAGTTIKTGANFNLTAAGGTGYTGTPGTNFTSNIVGTPNAGTVGGAGFGVAVGGTASGTFFYDEVGNFGLKADAVRDTSFTAVDQPNDCIASSTSDSLSGGQYGCWIGSTAVADITGLGFGRFIPDNFGVAYNAPAFGNMLGCGQFTYVGRSFTYTTAPVMTVTARKGITNGLDNSATTNYAGSYMKLANSGTSLNQAPYNTQAGRYTRFDALGGGTTPAFTIAGPDTTTDPVIGTFTNGVGTLTFGTSGAGTSLAFTRSATTPSAPFDADFALALNVVDEDGVAFASNPAAFGAAAAGSGIGFTGGKAMRFGRLRLQNASGSQLVPLSILAEAQYWSGSGKSFIANPDDGCTVVNPTHVAMGAYTGTLTDTPKCLTAVSGGGTLSSGRSTFKLAAPGGSVTGSVTLTANLGASASGNTCAAIGGAPAAATAANLPHLQGNWTGGSYNQNPSGRGTFGTRRGSDEVIHNRENF